jgi:hypothetical protein
MVTGTHNPEHRPAERQMNRSGRPVERATLVGQTFSHRTVFGYQRGVIDVVAEKPSQH